MALKDIGVRAVVENVGGYLRDMDRMENSLQRFGRVAQRNSAVFKKTGLALVGFAAAGTVAFGVAVKSFVAFEQALANAGAVASATTEEMEAMSAAAREMGRTTVFTATESAQALSFLAMAGFEVGEAVEALPGVLQLAAAAQIDLGQAADIASNILSGYGFEVEQLTRVNDVMAKAFVSANTNLSQLGDAMKFAGPVASAAGVRFEEATAALALMGNAGIQATMAGRSLRAALAQMLKPTTEAEEVMGRLGLTFTDSTGNLLPLVDIIGQLEKASLTATDGITLFGRQAGPALLALVSQGTDALEGLTEELLNSGGTAQQIADRQLATLGGQIALLKSAFEGLAIELGASVAPAVGAVADAATRLTSALGDMNPTLLKFLAIAAGAGVILAGVAGPMLLIVGFLPQIISGFATLRVAMVALGTVGVGPIGLVIAGLAVLTGVILPEVISRFTDAKNAAEGFGDALTDVGIGPFRDLRRSLAVIEESIRKVKEELGDPDGASDRVTFLTGRLQDLTVVADSTRIELQDLGNALLNVGLTASETTEITDTLAGTFEEAKEPVFELTDALDDLGGAADETGKALFGLAGDAKEAFDAQVAANEEFFEVAESLRILDFQNAFENKRRQRALDEAAATAALELQQEFADRAQFFRDLNAKTARQKAEKAGGEILADLRARNEDREAFERRTAATIAGIQGDAAAADAARRATDIMNADAAQAAIAATWDRLRFDLDDLVIDFRRSGFSLQEIVEAWADSTFTSVDNIMDALARWGIGWDDTLRILETAEPQMEAIIKLLEEQAAASLEAAEATEVNMRAQENLARLQARAQGREFGPGGLGRLAPSTLGVERAFAGLLANIGLAESRLLTDLPEPALADFLAAVTAFFASGLSAGDAILAALRQFSGAFIPEMGHGGSVLRGGAAIVGDRGPELVMLPTGAQVIPNISRSTTFNVDAHYADTQQPASIAQDLESLTMLAGS